MKEKNSSTQSVCKELNAEKQEKVPPFLNEIAFRLSTSVPINIATVKISKLL